MGCRDGRLILPRNTQEHNDLKSKLQMCAKEKQKKQPTNKRPGDFPAYKQFIFLVNRSYGHTQKV